MRHDMNPFCEWPMGNNAGFHCSECCTRIKDHEAFLAHTKTHANENISNWCNFKDED